MPKLVDHDAKKIEIAKATWKVIVREGLDNATVRNIARETGMSVGSLRHYFPSQSDLLQFSMELVSERVATRIREKNMMTAESPVMAIQDAISELLPLDEERRVEAEVWFVFSAKALVDARLKQLSDQVYNDMRQGFEWAIQSLRKLGLAREDLRADLEVYRLHALVDGMAVHHLLHPDKLTYRQMVDTLSYHLRSLCK
jgi:AcrR family transcriptional regulator